MATYLQLVQDAASESGTVSAPATVDGLTGRPARFAGWVRRAWREIQNARDDWKWMDEQFSGTTLDGVRSYDPAALGISSFGDWRAEGYNGTARLTCLDPTDPDDTPRPLLMRPWDSFELDILRSSVAADRGRPKLFTVTPQRDLSFYPMPDASYTIAGRYQTGAQTLTLDSDVPKMPARYHDAIMWKALTLMARFDEAGDLLGSYDREFLRFWRDMVNEQTPDFGIAGPLGK